jgi:hypothetical protein
VTEELYADLTAEYEELHQLLLEAIALVEKDLNR